jgi:hemerythrin-like domain-containing protein
MTVNLGARPPADFTEPIEMMKDCHRRIEHFLDVLRKVVQQFGEDDLNDAGRRALETSLNYFANFAPRHTADEEQSLFPRLRRSESLEARAAIADLDQLERDHRKGEHCHALVDELARQWLDTGRLDEGPRKILTAAIDVLTAMYAEHIRLEEQRVFVVANEVLQDEILGEIGEEMRARRSLTRLSPDVAGSQFRTLVGN